MRWATFLWIAILYCSTAHSEVCASVHARMFGIFQQFNDYRSLGFSVRTGSNRLTIERRRNEENHILFADGQIIGRGILSLGLLTRSEVAPERLAGFRGQALFDLMMEYFEGQVRGVSGEWLSGSDNLAAFQSLVWSEANLQTAAKGTWSGRQALRHGYTEVEILDAATDPFSGEYTKVVVLFTKKEVDRSRLAQTKSSLRNPQR